jgi:predicted DNA-binding transcriptional regulator AlpA
MAVTVPLVSPGDRLRLAEVADLLDTSRATAARYVSREDFPEPIDEDRGRMWRRSDVQRWGKKHLPLPTGRPPKEDA